ncbi:MAG: hypothetical protein EOM50_12315 [Erysipelotrichia bacterium]|nr:hypothetical protein [Erysipelotrichia bacterium]NCC55276.1 hypothetical protein [Erysipelotrichia bacterium]
MKKQIDMICISPRLLDGDIDTMLLISEKIPVVTCIQNIFEEKVTYTDFVCLLNGDELSAYGEEQQQRNFKKKYVAIVHDDIKLLKKAHDFGYQTIAICDDVETLDTIDMHFTNLEEMYEAMQKETKKENLWGTIFLFIAILILIFSQQLTWNISIHYYLLLSGICLFLSIFFYRIRKIWKIIAYVLDSIL